MPTVGDHLDHAAARFADSGISSPRLDAEVLLAHAMGIGRASLLARRDEPLAAGEREAFERLVARREARVPIAYLLGRREFWSLEFEVNERVMIPRPETELVVEEAIRLLRNGCSAAAPWIGRSGEASAETPRSPLLFADVGTGAGPIVVALARELGEAVAHATDVSTAALEVARRNAARHGVEGRIRFHLGDLLTPVLEAGIEGAFGLVASNMPYVGAAEDVDEEVRRWEPPQAVFGGPRGHEAIARLLPQAARALRPGGVLVLEIGPSIEAEVRAMLAGGEDWSEVAVRADLAGRPRVITARRAGNAA